MPTIFSHAIAALGVGTLVLPRNCSHAVWTAGVMCSMLPDADVIGFRFGISYGDMLGHRGLSHSLLFAALLSAAVTLAFSGNQWRGSRLRIGLFLLLVTAAHGVLDALTNGGLGIAFLAPFSDQRFFFPMRPIEVSPIGTAFFSARGVGVMKSELAWVWLPTLAIAAASLAVRLRARPH